MMLHRRARGRHWWVAFLLLLSFCLVTPLAAAPAARSATPTPITQTGPISLQDAFAAAAREFGVPESVLLAVSYNLSRWEQHGSAPSFAGGYGLMHLTDVDITRKFDGRGDGIARSSQSVTNDLSLHTLDTAAKLLGVSPDLLKHDPVQNIRGGAVLLAQYALDTVGTKPANEADWYGAVVKYNGSPDALTARDFANAVYATIRQGVVRTTSDGQTVSLMAKEVTPATSTANSLPLRSRRGAGLECPRQLDCEFIPAAYELNDPTDLTNYGNYDLAARPRDGLKIRYIMIHDTQIDYDITVRLFQNPLAYAATHYLIRSSDGHVAQMVENKNVAWHAGNWYVNGHAIGIEHEGVAIEGATWYTEQMYRASARLVRYLADKFDIPLDRAHIIGHDEIPGPTPPFQAGMHWDPGPFWDWAHYMELLGAPIRSSDDGNNRIVTIRPNFETNRPPMTYCYDREVDDCRDVPLQGANFVYLRSAPNLDAPLITNPYIGADPTRANNWANKAMTGQQFYRVERRGSWDAIYFSGQKAWFRNPGRKNTVRGSGILVTPKAGLASIPVYGRAYPEETAYPPDVAPQALVPIYEMPAGQIYVAADRFRSDYYSAPTYAPTLEESDHQVITGRTRYYQIFFNHRFGFVKVSDVDLVDD
jgi:N-acetyl-anhydromuramyl-L-alanine amidase AmpD